MDQTYLSYNNTVTYGLFELDNSKYLLIQIKLCMQFYFGDNVFRQKCVFLNNCNDFLSKQTCWDLKRNVSLLNICLDRKYREYSISFGVI